MSAIQQWLEALDLAQYAEVFERNHIDEALLPDLDHDVLSSIGIDSAGHRLRILKAARTFAAQDGDEDPGPHQPPPAPPGAAVDEAERRQLTIMFADLVGSTDLSRRLDPEDLREVNRTYQDAAKLAIETYGGYVARYMGDGVLAYFGYPSAHEDDAVRAVRAGLELTDAIPRLRANDEPLAVRVGIATGAVVVGDLIGEGASQESAVVGETPNLAARFQALAEPNQVVFGDTTQRLLGTQLGVRSLGEANVKGVPLPVATYTVTHRQTPTPNLFVRRDLTPLVGRDNETALLLDRWRQAEKGFGQSVLITGEPGVGKSRLVQELLTRAGAESGAIWWCQCSPHEAGVALHPLKACLEWKLGFTPTMAAQEKVALLTEQVAKSQPSDAGSVSILSTLLSISAEVGAQSLSLASNELRDRTFESLLHLVEHSAASATTLMVVEDLHWSDAATLALLNILIDRIRSTPILLVLTARPEFSPPWNAQPARLGLNHLTEDDCLTVVRALASAQDLSGEAMRTIVARSDGVPLFVEELTQSAMHLNDEGTIPATLRDALTARLDRLEVGKRVAQFAAVIGREFDHALLAAAWEGEEAPLVAGIDELRTAGLVYARGFADDAVYEFKHALIRDAAYESLIRDRRRQYHRRVAEAMSHLRPAIAEEEPALLAHHWTEANDPALASGLWLAAASQAILNAASDDARTLLDRLRRVLDKMDDTEDVARLRVDADFAAVRIASMTVGWTHKNYHDAALRGLTGARALGDPGRCVLALSGLAGYFRTKGDATRSLSYAQECLDVATASGDETLIKQGHLCLGYSHHHANEHELVAMHLERGDAAHGSVASRRALVWNHGIFGRYDQMVEFGKDALRVAEASGSRELLAHGLWALTEAYIARGEAEEALRTAQRYKQLVENHRIGDFHETMCRDLLAKALNELGRGEEALALARDALEWRLRLGGRQREPAARSLLATCLAQTGHFAEAEREFDEALVVANAVGWREEVRKGIGITLAQYPGPWPSFSRDDAEPILRETVSSYETRGLLGSALRAALILAEHLRNLQRPRDAHAVLAPLYGKFVEGFDAPILRNARALLDELS